jgi:hypothetical protein
MHELYIQLNAEQVTRGSSSSPCLVLARRWRRPGRESALAVHGRRGQVIPQSRFLLCREKAAGPRDYEAHIHVPAAMRSLWIQCPGTPAAFFFLPKAVMMIGTCSVHCLVSTMVNIQHHTHTPPASSCCSQGVICMPINVLFNLECLRAFLVEERRIKKRKHSSSLWDSTHTRVVSSLAGS